MTEEKLESEADAIISDSSEVVRSEDLSDGAGKDDIQPGSPFSQTAQQESLASVDANLRAQSDLLKSGHNLLVDIASKIAHMSDDAVGRATRPVFIDLILLYDSLQQARTWASSSAQLTREAVKDRLGILEAELLEILLRRDVQKVQETGTKLDRQQHRAVKVVATADPDEDNQIREVVRAGFAVGERVLRPADVVVGKYDPTIRREGA